MAMAIVGVRPAWKFASPCGYLVRVTDTTDFHLGVDGVIQVLLGGWLQNSNPVG
jgi:hypothetical protein